MAKDKAKGKGHPMATEPAPADEGIRKGDQKVLAKFLEEVEGNLWGISSGDREKALKDLRAHILERYKPHQTEHAMDVALSAMGDPDVIARGIRTLYGYGVGFKSVLVVICFLFGLTTVPMIGAWSLVGPWPVLGLLGTFLIISSTGPQVGLKWGGLMGLAAATSRVLLVVGLAFGLPDDFTVGTNQAVVDFVLVSLFLLVVGLLAGQIREASMKDFLQEEVV